MADDTTFTLRPMVHADGPALAALGEQTPETGMVSMHSRFERDAYDTLLALRPGTIGVVAEAADHPGLVGLCLMSFAQCWFEGAIRPSAYLYSLSVHPGYRRRGLASRLTAWLVGTAHERYGNDVVIYAGATVLGRVTVGRGSVIGGNVWLTRSVAPGSRIVQAQADKEVFENGAGI